MKRDTSVVRRMQRRFLAWVRFGRIGSNECLQDNTCPSTGSGRTDLFSVSLKISREAGRYRCFVRFAGYLFLLDSRLRRNGGSNEFFGLKSHIGIVLTGGKF
jgi:hypothetical protein